MKTSTKERVVRIRTSITSVIIVYVIHSSEESSDPEASAVSHPGWRAALAERRQQAGEMDEWPQPKAAAKPPGRTQRTAPPPLPKGSSSSTDEVDSEDGENGETLQSICPRT